MILSGTLRELKEKAEAELHPAATSQFSPPHSSSSSASGARSENTATSQGKTERTGELMIETAGEFLENFNPYTPHGRLVRLDEMEARKLVLYGYRLGKMAANTSRDSVEVKRKRGYRPFVKSDHADRADLEPESLALEFMGAMLESIGLHEELLEDRHG